MQDISNELQSLITVLYDMKLGACGPIVEELWPR